MIKKLFYIIIYRYRELLKKSNNLMKEAKLLEKSNKFYRGNWIFEKNRNKEQQRNEYLTEYETRLAGQKLWYYDEIEKLKLDFEKDSEIKRLEINSLLSSEERSNKEILILRNEIYNLRSENISLKTTLYGIKK